jgi:bifunctional DNA-binding transcriptional regulator/antitoxin component of YhaV-PrlF toxin-antitoxin module
MTYTAAITSQGQLNLPVALRKALGITGPTRAVITRKGNTFTVEPTPDFWSVAGKLKGTVKLSDAELAKARKQFSREWADEMPR